MPGRTFAGKTTLVADLVRKGATYYSDEFAVLDRAGRVHPYARPLQIRDQHTHRQTQCPVERLGGVAGRDPLPVDLVIVSRYRKGSQWRPKTLSTGAGFLELLNNTVSARSAPEIAFKTLKQAVSSAVMVKGSRGDTPQLIEWIAQQFDSPRTRLDVRQ